MSKKKESISKLNEALDELLKIPSDETLQNLKKVKYKIELIEERWKTVPRMATSPDLHDLKDVCKEYIDSIKDTGRHMKDGEHYIFEAALEAIYGKDIFDWVNKHDQGE